MAKAATTRQSRTSIASQAVAADARRRKAAIAAEDQAMKAATEAAPAGPVTELEKKLTAEVERLKQNFNDLDTLFFQEVEARQDVSAQLNRVTTQLKCAETTIETLSRLVASHVEAQTISEGIPF